MIDTGTRPIRIAFADDHAMLRRSIITYLNAVEDFDVICDGGNGKELLAAIEVSAIKPDICLLDVSMPVMNGYDTLIALKKKLPETKVLVLTMIDHEGNFARMLNAGADGYLLKDEEIDELVSAIRMLFDHGYYHNPKMPKILPFLRRQGKAAGVLSGRHEQFLKLCTTELSYKEIAQAMNVSEKTVEGFRSALCAGLGVKSRIGLALYALQTGLAVFGQLDNRVEYQ